MTERYKINSENVVYRIIDGEAVILNLDNGHYYSLNGVGTQIWEFLNKRKNLDEILNSLREEYRLPEKKVRGDLMELVKDLKKEKLIKHL